MRSYENRSEIRALRMHLIGIAEETAARAAGDARQRGVERHEVVGALEAGEKLCDLARQMVLQQPRLFGAQRQGERPRLMV
jgi:hypothetical protein